VTARELDPAIVAKWRIDSRARQGLPPTIEDPALIAKIKRLALGPVDPTPAPRRKQRARGRAS
jgi:hypothetical protein